MGMIEDFIDLEEATEKLRYKPAWKFQAGIASPGSLNYYTLTITAAVLHSETFEPVTFEIRRVIPRVALSRTAAFYSWVEDMIMEAEIHEIREFFRVDGKVWDNPHESKPAT